MASAPVQIGVDMQCFPYLIPHPSYEGEQKFHQEMKASEENQESLAFLYLLSAGVSGVAPCLLYVVLGINPRGILP